MREILQFSYEAGQLITDLGDGGKKTLSVIIVHEADCRGTAETPKPMILVRENSKIQTPFL